MTAPLKTVPGIQASTGAGSAGCLVVTDSDGLLDPSFFPVNGNSYQLGNLLVQFGSNSAPQPASGQHTTSKSFTFPLPFGSAPEIFINSKTFPVTSSGGGLTVTGTSTMLAGTALFDDNDFSNVAGGINTAIAFGWIAIGLAP